MKKIGYITFFLSIVFLMVALIIYPNRYIPVCFEGIKLWAVVVLPSLLPFFFLTALLTSFNKLTSLTNLLSPLTKRLYNASGISAYVQLMSFLSGYPVGAKLISELFEHNIIEKDEATRMSTFCSTSGPLFIVGSVATTMFQNKSLGAILLLAHLLSSIICGLCFRFYGAKSLKLTQKVQRVNAKNSDNVLYKCIYGSVISIIVVGGFVAIFYTLSQIISDFKILKVIEAPLSLILGDKANGFSQGLIESTKGCRLLSKSADALSASLCSALIAFGGLSIICQSVVYLKKADVKISVFICSKFLQAIFAFLITFCLLKLIHIL